MSRKTKIICTMGPATDDPAVLEQMIRAGMDVARFNFSHGDHPEHKARMDELKKVRAALGTHTAILLDTKGPEIRTGLLKNGSVMLQEGQTFTLTTKAVEGDETCVSVSYPNLPAEVKPGSQILIDDGLIELVVEKTTKTDIVCTVKNGGRIANRKGVNLPGTTVKMPYMSEKDKSDILFGIENDVDFIAASFVRNAFDVLEVKKVLEQNGGKDILVIAKIENADGVRNIDEILKVCDGIMIARGDMGVEIPFEELPSIQKMLIKKCNLTGKVAVTATQMLESMIEKPRPTRAEITDIANAVYDGTSAIMLSGETAVGKYPVEAVKTMASVAVTTEGDINYYKRFQENEIGQVSVTNAISHATCMTAHDLEAAAIITISKSGYTARMVSKYRPAQPIVATVVKEKIARQLSITWGIIPVLATMQQTSDALFDHAVEQALTTGIVKNGDIVVLTAGVPLGVSGTTNILRVHMVGHVLCKGVGITNLSVSGNVCVARSEEEAIRKFNDGDILVIKETSNQILDILKKSSGIITEAGGKASHAAVVGMALDLPVIVEAEHATALLKSGTVVTMDGAHGLVYSGVTKVF